MGFFDFVEDAAKGVGAAVFGSGDDPGILGTGHQQFDKREIDPNSFQDPDSAHIKGVLDRRLAAADQRKGATMNAAIQGNIERYGGTKLGPTAQSQGAIIDRSQDNQVRGDQMSLVQQLQRQANGQGPSLATNQLKLAQDRNVAQQMGIAGAGGGNPALARRNALLAAAAGQRQTAMDSANVRMQEQLNAQGQLGNVLNNVRGADIGVATSQANLGQQNNQFNAGALNTANLAQGQLDQQTGLYNTGAYNDMLARNTANRQQANLQNLEAEMRQRGYNDAQVQFLLQQRMRQQELDRQGNIAYQQMMTDQERAFLAPQSQAYSDAAKGRAELVRNLMESKTIPFDGGGDKKDG